MRRAARGRRPHAFWRNARTSSSSRFAVPPRSALFCEPPSAPRNTQLHLTHMTRPERLSGEPLLQPGGRDVGGLILFPTPRDLCSNKVRRSANCLAIDSNVVVRPFTGPLGVRPSVRRSVKNRKVFAKSSIRPGLMASLSLADGPLLLGNGRSRASVRPSSGRPQRPQMDVRLEMSRKRWTRLAWSLQEVARRERIRPGIIRRCSMPSSVRRADAMRQRVRRATASSSSAERGREAFKNFIDGASHFEPTATPAMSATRQSLTKRKYCGAQAQIRLGSGSRTPPRRSAGDGNRPRPDQALSVDVDAEPVAQAKVSGTRTRNRHNPAAGASRPLRNRRTGPREPACPHGLAARASG